MLDSLDRQTGRQQSVVDGQDGRASYMLLPEHTHTHTLDGVHNVLSLSTSGILLFVCTYFNDMAAFTFPLRVNGALVPIEVLVPADTTAAVLPFVIATRVNADLPDSIVVQDPQGRRVTSVDVLRNNDRVVYHIPGQCTLPMQVWRQLHVCRNEQHRPSFFQQIQDAHVPPSKFALLISISPMFSACRSATGAATSAGDARSGTRRPGWRRAARGSGGNASSWARGLTPRWKIPTSPAGAPSPRCLRPTGRRSSSCRPA